MQPGFESGREGDAVLARVLAEGTGIGEGRGALLNGVPDV
jgi:hypothetical protein